MLKVTIVSFGRIIDSTKAVNMEEATAWIKEHHYDALEAKKRCGICIEPIKKNKKFRNKGLQHK